MFFYLRSDAAVSLPEDTGRLLREQGDDDRAALDRLLPLVYQELRAAAESYLGHERSDHTLQPTALIHEAYLRLVDRESLRFNDREHFLALAAQAMRRILVDHARGRRRVKRGGDRAKIPLNEETPAASDRAVDLLALDEALASLKEVNGEHARLVELRFFGGLTIDETARVLGVSTSSVERGWRCARVWLYRELAKGDTRIEEHDDGSNGAEPTNL